MIELFNFNHAWFNTRLYMYCEISAFIYMQDKMLVYIASITLVFLLKDSSCLDIYVNPVNGSNSATCAFSNSASNPCQSLQWVLQQKYRKNGTLYHLSDSGTHFLNSSVATFQDFDSISFIGYEGVPTVECSENIGLAFERMTNINFTNVSFLNCSAIRKSTSKNYGDNSTGRQQFRVALYFYACQNISMNGVNVSYSMNATGVVVYDTVGVNSFVNSIFSNNNASNGGGGFYLEFTYCIPGDTSCENNVTSYTSMNKDSEYTFDSCSFIKNQAKSTDELSTHLIPYRADHVAFGRGGGLSIYMTGNATNNKVYISNSHITDNSAVWGGGLFVEFDDDTSNNSVIVSRSIIEGNECYFDITSGTGGGGIRIAYYLFQMDTQTIGNQVLVDDCNLTNNAALNGGGISITVTAQNNQKMGPIGIVNTEFEANIAKLGSALNIDRFLPVTEGFMLTVVLCDCLFIRNTAEYTKYLQEKQGSIYNAYSVGIGAVYTNQVPVVFKHNVLFDSNVGSALAAVGTSLDFTNCRGTFTKNIGSNGAAISLLGVAYIRVSDNTILIFSKNNARINGGAIYNLDVNKETLASYENCFIRHINPLLSPIKWNSTFNFSANFDQGGTRPSAIHTTSILPCTWSGRIQSSNVTTAFCWNANWHYFPTSTSCKTQIHSDVSQIVVNYTSKTQHNPYVVAFPGEKFNMPIVMRDDLSEDVGNQTLFSISVNSYKKKRTAQYFWGGDSNLNLTTSIKNYNMATLLLDSIGPASWHVNVLIKLLPCPPGFTLHGNECVCVEGSYSGTVTCSKNTQKAFLKEDNWIGNMPIRNETHYVVSFCPPRFCSKNTSIPLPTSSEDNLDHAVCGPRNRTGTLCGECLPGFAVTVNTFTFDCINCTDEDIGINTIKYIAAVYIPLTAVFTAIIFLNIRLTSAPANAFILYSQVIASAFDLSADGQIPIPSSFLQGYKVPYGIFNLQFVERLISPICLGQTNALDALMLDYVVAIFPLIMIGVVLICFKIKECCQFRCGKKIYQSQRNRRQMIMCKSQWNVNKALLPAFGAFVLLSYNKFSMTSSYIMNTKSPLNENGHSVGLSHVYYAGNFNYNDSLYQKKYFLPACAFFLIFVVMPPLFLLHWPMRIFEWYLSKVNCVWRRYPSDKIHILLDIFQGCYKNNMRFFAGLYFLFRLFINISYMVTPTWSSQYLIQQIACAIMVTLIAVCQPYNEENKIFNTIDILIFTNLGFLNALSFYLYSLTQLNPDAFTLWPGALIFQYILVFLPMVYMITYVIWYLIKPYKKQIILKLVPMLLRSRSSPLTYIGADGTTKVTRMSVSQAHTNIKEDEALLKRAEEENRYRPPSASPLSSEKNSNSRSTTTPSYGSTRETTRVSEPTY